MSFKQDLKLLIKPYYLLNILLSLSYVLFKRIPGICNYLFGVRDCEFDGRETEILFFLVIVVMIRSRKTGSITMINYLSSSFIYTKVANLILWFYADFILGIIYAIAFILMGLLIPAPTYSGPDSVIYFRGTTTLEEELNRNKKIWIVGFYTAWNPACVNFAPIFAKLSTDFQAENLKFGKLDIGRYPEGGKKYGVNDSSFSQQLPTIIVFKDGVEVDRRPLMDSKGKVVKFLFSEENIIAAFNLKKLLETCKNNFNQQKRHVKVD